jgi:membrane protease YdiL (CAAX protease family)
MSTPDPLEPSDNDAPLVRPARDHAAALPQSDGFPGGEAPLVRPAHRSFRALDFAGAILAWLIIVGVVTINILGVRRSSLQQEAGPQAKSDVLFNLQARYLVGAGQIQPGNKQGLVPQAMALENAGQRQRLEAIIVQGELGGPAQALQRLQVANQGDSSPEAALLTRLYTDYSEKRWEAADVLTRERETLRLDFGWYGELALHPAEGPNQQAREAVLAPARRTAFTLMALVICALVLGALGTVGLVALIAAWALRRIRGGMVDWTGRAAIWVETFAVYLLLFAGLSEAASYLPTLGLRVSFSGLAMILSLAALCWPRLRGLSWEQIGQNLGWNSGRGVWREVAAGLATYVMAIPLALAGLLIMLALMALSRGLPGQAAPGASPGGTPEHPIVPIVATGGFGLKLMILLLAAVLAPIVEETMFRGVLYRHLRELTGRFGGAFSFLFSASLASLVFAALHPQGWLGIPPLMGIAIGLTVGREWRGSLIAPMVAHGLNNGLVMTLLVLASS